MDEMIESLFVALQPNGERILVERWVWEMWRRGAITDPLLLAPLRNAISVYGYWAGQFAQLRRISNETN